MPSLMGLSSLILHTYADDDPPPAGGSSMTKPNFPDGATILIFVSELLLLPSFHWEDDKDDIKMGEDSSFPVFLVLVSGGDSSILSDRVFAREEKEEDAFFVLSLPGGDSSVLSDRVFAREEKEEDAFLVLSVPVSGGNDETLSDSTMLPSSLNTVIFLLKFPLFIASNS